MPVARRFLQTQGAIHRIAFGTPLVWPTARRDESYEAIVGLIRTVPLSLAGARDFTYQVNRPRTSLVVPELELNRLAKWVSIRGSIVLADIASQTLSRSPEAHAVKLELDISSDAARRIAIDGERLPSLFDELIRLAKEIPEAGDTP